jgi:uncharacterized membrane protein YgcG
MPSRAVCLPLVAPVLLFAACSSAPVGPGAPVPHGSASQAQERTSTTAAALSGPVTRSQVIANAEQWVTAKLLYCQSANGQPDGDTSCSSTCDRESNPEWDPYRSDCSGFVSWAWELPSPGLVTSEFAPFDTSVSTEIDCTAMEPGDAANRNPDTGHIVIFEKWVTPGQEALFFEEPGCSSSTPYAHEFDSTVTCSGSTVNITYEGDTFTAIRYDQIVDDPADAGTGSSSGSSGGSGSGSSSGSSGSGSGSSSGSGGSSSGSSSGGSTGSSSGSSSGSGGTSSGSSGSSGGTLGGSGSGSGGGGSTPAGGNGSTAPDAGGGPIAWDTSAGGPGCAMSGAPRSDWELGACAPLAFVVLARRRRARR